MLSRAHVVTSLFVCAATAAPAFATGFSLSVAAFGEGGSGSPWRTSDGSSFFIHSEQDYGDGSPGLQRPSHSAFVGSPDTEWTSYLTHDALGPTRRGGSPHNPSDQFYLSRGVYSSGFSNRSSALVSFTPSLGALTPEGIEAREASIESGRISGASFIAGPPVAAGQSPFGTRGLMLARLTVARGTTIAGQVLAFLTPTMGGPSDQVQLTLNGDQSGGYLLQALLVAQVEVTDPGFGSETAFGSADVYDIWLAQVPSPSSALLFGALGLALSSRRRRALNDIEAKPNGSIHG